MKVFKCQICKFDVAEEDVYLYGNYTCLCEACSDNEAFSEEDD